MSSSTTLSRCFLRHYRSVLLPQFSKHSIQFLNSSCTTYSHGDFLVNEVFLYHNVLRKCVSASKLQSQHNSFILSCHVFVSVPAPLHCTVSHFLLTDYANVLVLICHFVFTHLVTVFQNYIINLLKCRSMKCSCITVFLCYIAHYHCSHYIF